MNTLANALVRTAAVALAVATLAGCQYRYNAHGERIYGLQFGQDNLREVDYTNPRLPILPKWRPNTDLWPSPSPFEFNDLSRWSFLDEDLRTLPPLRVGDNAGCAGCSESTARLALLVSRADAVDGRSAALVR
ncbi:MAG: hypothetical protein IT518_17265 [Burkholderiales bacterium]|nr:hypothetical protein [Burkholderiales bacterium]